METGSIKVQATQACVRRHPANPVLRASQVPYRSDLVLNAAVTKYRGKYVMLFRNDIRSSETTVSEGVYLGLALSDDGIAWKVESEPVLDMHAVDPEFNNVYDPRVTVMDDGRCLVTFGMDTRHGVRGGIAITEDFRHFDVRSVSTPDNRNFVVFPRKFGGNYLRLERPFPIYGRPGHPERFDIWYSDSPDLVYWGNPGLLLGVEHVPFADLKLGAGAPPILTEAGWLCVFHASDFDPNRGKNGFETSWKKRYVAGVMLLDREDPRKIVGMCKEPLIVPEAPYETTEGYRHNVIFPTGAILEDSGELKIYYGASDTVMALATAHVDDLVALCTEPRGAGAAF